MSEVPSQRGGGRKPNPGTPASESPYPALDLLLLLFILSLLLQPLVEPDFGWHLRTGLDLLSHGGRMPALDPYSHTVPDWPWVEHAWLTDAVLALVYQGLGSAGPMGVILLFAAVTGAAFAVAAGSAGAGRVGRVGRVGRTARLSAVALALWTAWPFLGARTQMVTLLGLAVLLRLLTRYQHGAVAHLWIVPPLFLLWTNVHGGVTAGLFVMGLFLIGSIALRIVMTSRLASKGVPAGRFFLDEPVPDWPQIRHVALVLLVSALVTLINPYGWRLHQEIFASLTDRFMIETLHEWQPVSTEFRAGRWFLANVGLLGIGLLLVYRRREPFRWLIVGVFLALSLRHWRNVPFFLLVSLPLWAEVLSGLTGRLAGVLAAGPDQAKRWLLGATLLVASGMAVLGPDHVEAVVRCGLAPAEYFRSTDYPIEAVEWIRAHRDRLGTHLYNDYGWGGFLLWWLPGEKIFIDGRMPAWRVGNRWIFYDYIALTAWDPPELGVLAKYGVDWAIVGVATPLERALKGLTEWEEVYRDGKAAIYVKRRS